MPDIRHRVGIRSSSAADVYAKLATIDGLSEWWTRTTKGESEPGRTIHFQFDRGFFDMKVLELVPGERVLWQVVDGPEEWIGTKVRFELRREGEHTIVLFTHEGWREPVELMHHCSTKWAVFLLSLKSRVETGAGAPAPDDVKIDEWN